MKQRLLFVLCVVWGLAGVSAAQTRTVTNFDLEKYRQKRIQAERELDEYYARRGITKEDLQRQEEEDKRAREELSARLTAERLEREKLELERRILELESRPPDVVYVEEQPRYFYGGGNFYGGGYYNPNGHFGKRPRNYPLYRTPSWKLRAWPSDRPTPLFRNPRTGPRFLRQR